MYGESFAQATRHARRELIDNGKAHNNVFQLRYIKSHIGRQCFIYESSSENVLEITAATRPGVSQKHLVDSSASSYKLSHKSCSRRVVKLFLPPHLSLFFTDVASVMLPKRDNLCSCIYSADADVIIRTETRLSSEVKNSDSFSSPERYNIYRCDTG